MSAPAWILVVDDDSAIRETLRAILEDEGYPVVAARNGREALESLEAMGRPACASSTW
jgi:CheY-like chemotaxis protein